MKLINLLKESLGLNEGVYDPGILKAFFLAGGPGSGKSFVAGKVTGGQGLKFINSDTYFEMLLKKAELGLDMTKMTQAQFKKSQDLRQAAKEKTKKTEANYLEGRLGVVFDGTGADYAKIKKLRDKCAELGYDTYMIFVNTSLDIALERNKQRERTVPEDIVKQSWQDVQNNLGKFQNLFGRSNTIVVDNNTFREDILNKVWKQIMSLLKQPVKNPIGKKWIEMQLAMKKRS